MRTVQCRTGEVASTMRHYRKTEHWRQIRAEKLAEQRGECEQCGATWHLSVHHKSYAGLGDEKLDDLALLCRACHIREHSEFGAPTKNILPQFRSWAKVYAPYYRSVPTRIGLRRIDYV